MYKFKQSMMRRGSLPMSMYLGASSAPSEGPNSLRSGTERCSLALLGLVAFESRRFLPNNPLFFFSSGGLLLALLLAVLGLDELVRKGVTPTPPAAGCAPGTEYHVERFDESKGM